MVGIVVQKDFGRETQHPITCLQAVLEKPTLHFLPQAVLEQYYEQNNKVQKLEDFLASKRQCVNSCSVVTTYSNFLSEDQIKSFHDTLEVITLCVWHRSAVSVRLAKQKQK